MRDMAAEPAVDGLTTQTEVKLEEAKPALPVFKPRWWYRADRLDARPVIWSLRNRPQDWAVRSWANEWERRAYTILHRPSGHLFWVGSGHPNLYDAKCSCTRSDRGRFQAFQGRPFKDAAQAWIAATYSPYHPDALDHQQFASHFVR